MLTRGARSRFGFFGNENNAISVKDAPVVKNAQAPNVVTRSRSALGDIKNKGLSVQQRDRLTQQNPKNCNPTKGAETCKSETQTQLSTVNVVKHQSSSTDFRKKRRSLRLKLLTNKGGKYFIDRENDDFGDTATVYPYAETIFNYLQDRELTVQPLNADFISAEGGINPRMRYILVNWLVQIHHSYKLQPETLYLSVALLDRYLMKHSQEVSKDCFQLVGVASLFIAAKFEEMYPPDISDFTAITHNTFSKTDIRNCEQNILQSLDFYLSIPIPLTYLRRLSRSIEADRTVHNLAKYLLELTIQEYDLASLSGNLRAAVALCLARALCLQTSNLDEVWSDVMIYMSGFTVDDLRGPLQTLARAAYRQNSPSKYRAIFDKYRLDDYYGRVAALPQLRSCLMETLADLKFDSDGELSPN